MCSDSCWDSLVDIWAAIHGEGKSTGGLVCCFIYGVISELCPGLPDLLGWTGISAAAHSFSVEFEERVSSLKAGFVFLL